MIPVASPDLSGNELAYVMDAVQSGWISSLGSYVTRFERDVARYCHNGNAEDAGQLYALAVCNGTAALHLALVALDISNGDEVLVPNYTFAATANAVLYVGATPVLCDVQEDGTISMDDVRKRTTSRTRAIIPVDLYGMPCSWNELTAWAKLKKLKVIADAAESLGGMYNSEKIGDLSDVDVSTFSFFANKNVVCGEGGMILTRNKHIYDRAMQLRDHGMRKEKRYWHDMVGFNYRMTNLQAAVGCAQMERLGEFQAKRRKVAQYYNARFEEHKDLVSVVKECPIALPSYWAYVVRLEGEWNADKRDCFLQELKRKGVETRPAFYPLHLMEPYRQFSTDSYPVTNRISQASFVIPIYPQLTIDDCEIVVTTVVDILATGAWQGGP
jgi:perosamine synthetase